MEMMMKKELAEKLIPINSDSNYGKRRHIGSHARKCFHKPRINPVFKSLDIADKQFRGIGD